VQSISVAVATDVHELAPSLHDDGVAWRRFAATGAGRDILGTEDLLDVFEDDLVAEAPDWLLITGDLTNNGERDSHLALATRLKRIEARGTQVLVIPGNHDVSNPWARAFRGGQQLKVPSVSPEEFASIYRDFGYGAGERDPHSLSYRVATPGVWFLMLDTNHYRHNVTQPETGGSLEAPTLAWIEDQARLARAAGARLVVGQHHSLLDHSAVISQGFTLDNADEVAALYRRWAIHLVLTGHIHIQDAVADEGEAGAVVDIATNALSVYPHQYGRLDLDPAGTARYRSRALPLTPERRAAAAQTFAEASSRVARTLLADLGPDADRAAAALGVLNQRYFAGTEALNTDLVDHPGYRALVASGGFLADYATSILADPGTDDNALDVDY